MGGELPLAAVRSQIASAVDVMVHLKRQRDGRRQVQSIVEVLDYEDGKIRCQSLYERQAEGEGKSRFQAVGTLQSRRKWQDAGLPELPAVRG